MAISFPSSPSSGDQFPASNGRLYIWDGSWTTKGDTTTPNPFAAKPFKFRSIYTRGYMIGGYKSSSPWKNANRTAHSTDTTTNLGDQIDYGASYIDGGYSDYNAYVYGLADSFSGASTWTSSISMATEIKRTHDSNWDTKTTRDDVACIMNSTLTMAYITAGGSTATDKHNYVTEVMYNAGSAPAGPTAGSSYGNAAAWQGEFKGWVWAGGGANFTFATETWASGGTTVGTDGWGKALSTKHGHAYVKNGGNIVTSAYKLNDTTGAQVRTDLNFDNSGEENYQTGQNWGYCLGHYNGVQNNNTYKIDSLTDSYTVLGSDAQPKGHDGASSGACASGSSLILGGN
jgi:hypothetical protein